MVVDRQPPADLLQPCQRPDDLPPRAQLRDDSEVIGWGVENGRRAHVCAIRHETLVKFITNKE